MSLPDTTTYGLVVRRPIGVCGAIVPWNFPLTLAANKVAPAIAAGNTVVLKPASTTPLSTLACIEALIEGGLPEGVVNVVLGQATGEAIVDHPLIRKIALTGSTPTGKKVMARAAEGLKKITLELGGSDPCIVLDDADLEAAARAISIGRFFNCGQACLAVKRLYVQEGVYDALMEKLVARASKLKPGNGLDKDSRMGPMHTETQRAEVEAQIKDAIDRGAQGRCSAAAGPKGADYDKGWFIEPTILENVPDGARMWTEEVFGPALPVRQDQGPRRGPAPRQRLAVRARLVDLDREHGRRAPRGAGARGGLHVGQRAADRARRAALRRHQAVGLRQGARRRGLPAVHRGEVGRLRRSVGNPRAVPTGA